MPIDGGADYTRIVRQKLASASGLRMQARQLQLEQGQERRMQDDEARLRRQIEQRLEEEAAEFWRLCAEIELRTKLAQTEAELEQTTQDAELQRLRAENDKLQAENSKLKDIHKQQPEVLGAFKMPLKSNNQFIGGGSEVARPCAVPFKHVSEPASFGCPPPYAIQTTRPSSQNLQQGHLATSAYSTRPPVGAKRYPVVAIAPVGAKRTHSQIEQQSRSMVESEPNQSISVQSSSSNNTGPLIARQYKKEHVYMCGYCGQHKPSISLDNGGRVRIRCECGGRQEDRKRRMHSLWTRVNDNDKKIDIPVSSGGRLSLVRDNPSPSSHPDNSQNSWSWVDDTYTGKCIPGYTNRTATLNSGVVDAHTAL